MAPGHDLNPLFRGQLRRAEVKRLGDLGKAEINVQFRQGRRHGLQPGQIFGDALQQAGIELFFERQ